MLDQDLRQSLDHTKTGVIALGVCIARVLAQTNPAILRSFAVEADRMHKHLCEHDHHEWGELLTRFAIAVGRPEKFPLFNPDSSPPAAN